MHNIIRSCISQKTAVCFLTSPLSTNKLPKRKSQRTLALSVLLVDNSTYVHALIQDIACPTSLGMSGEQRGDLIQMSSVGKSVFFNTELFELRAYMFITE